MTCTKHVHFFFAGVMPPDESQKYVHNSVYTNYVAKLAFEADHDISRSLRINATGDPDWLKTAEDLEILFDKRLQYHPEYEGYRKGQSDM